MYMPAQNRTLFVQPFDISRQSRHHQIHTIRCLGQALVDISKRVSIEPTKRISRNNTKSNLVSDRYEHFIWTQRLHYPEHSLDLLQGSLVKQLASCIKLLSLLISFMLPGLLRQHIP